MVSQQFLFQIANAADIVRVLENDPSISLQLQNQTAAKLTANYDPSLHDSDQKDVEESKTDENKTHIPPESDIAVVCVVVQHECRTPMPIANC